MRVLCDVPTYYGKSSNLVVSGPATTTPLGNNNIQKAVEPAHSKLRRAHLQSNRKTLSSVSAYIETASRKAIAAILPDNKSRNLKKANRGEMLMKVIESDADEANRGGRLMKGNRGGR